MMKRVFISVIVMTLSCLGLYIFSDQLLTILDKYIDILMTVSWGINKFFFNKIWLIEKIFIIFYTLTQLCFIIYRVLINVGFMVGIVFLVWGVWVWGK